MSRMEQTRTDRFKTALLLMAATAERGADLARQRGLDALFLLRDDEGNAMGVGVGRLFSEEPAAIASAGLDPKMSDFQRLWDA